MAKKKKLVQVTKKFKMFAVLRSINKFLRSLRKRLHRYVSQHSCFHKLAKKSDTSLTRMGSVFANGARHYIYENGKCTC